MCGSAVLRRRVPAVGHDHAAAHARRAPAARDPARVAFRRLARAAASATGAAARASARPRARTLGGGQVGRRPRVPAGARRGGAARHARGRGPGPLLRLRRGARQAALGRQDARVRAADPAAGPAPAGRAVRPPDPRRTAGRGLADGGAVGTRDRDLRRALVAPARAGRKAGRPAHRRRAVPRGALRGARPRPAGRAAAGVRVHRRGVRPGGAAARPRPERLPSEEWMQSAHAAPEPRRSD